MAPLYVHFFDCGVLYEGGGARMKGKGVVAEIRGSGT